MRSDASHLVGGLRIQFLSFERGSLERRTFERRTFERRTFERRTFERRTLERRTLERRTLERRTLERRTFVGDGAEVLREPSRRASDTNLVEPHGAPVVEPVQRAALVL